MCVCVCVCVTARTYVRKRVCVCDCVCVSVHSVSSYDIAAIMTMLFLPLVHGYHGDR